LTQLLIALAAFAFSETALSLDADCYDKGEDYYIPAKDLLEAKKKALLCFFAEISFKSSVKEGNQDIDFKQETNLEAKSSLIDWQGLRKDVNANLYRWPISDVNANLKALSLANDKKIIPVTKEVQEVWHSNVIKKEIIELVSNPSGATVAFDGLEGACQTPCKLEVLYGLHTVSLWKPDFSRQSGTIMVDGTRDSFLFELKENIGRIDYQNCPAGTSILFDGNRVGQTSNGQLKLAPGNYVLEFEHPEYFKTNKMVAVKVGETIRVPCDMKPKMGGLEVSARDSSGQPVKASVEIDGVAVGQTPGVFDVRAGSRRVRLFYQEEAWEDTVAVEKSSVTKLSKNLTPIESEAEKQLKASLRGFTFSANFGSMNEQKMVERKTNDFYDFKQCGSADPDKGTTTRVRLTKNVFNNFGFSIGGLFATYTVCHSSFDSKTYREILSTNEVEYYGMTAGAHYTLYTDTKSNDSSSPLYTRWLTFSLSAINGLNFTVTNKESGTKWSGKGSQKILGEISLIDFVVGRVRISLIEIASIPNGSLEYSSPVEIENLNMLYIFGLGMVF
jgi:hypothetical protein